MSCCDFPFEVDLDCPTAVVWTSGDIFAAGDITVSGFGGLVTDVLADGSIIVSGKGVVSPANRYSAKGVPLVLGKALVVDKLNVIVQADIDLFGKSIFAGRTSRLWVKLPCRAKEAFTVESGRRWLYLSTSRPTHSATTSPPSAKFLYRAALVIAVSGLHVAGSVLVSGDGGLANTITASGSVTVAGDGGITGLDRFGASGLVVVTGEAVIAFFDGLDVSGSIAVAGDGGIAGLSDFEVSAPYPGVGDGDTGDTSTLDVSGLIEVFGAASYSFMP